MRKKNMNKQIIKALAVGISATMALQPVAAVAAETEESNDGIQEEESLQNQDAASAEQGFEETVSDVAGAVEEVGGAIVAAQENNEVADGNATVELISEDTANGINDSFNSLEEM